MSNSDLPSKRTSTLLTCAVFRPDTNIIIDALIVWQIFRQISPLKARTRHIQQGVDNLATITGMRSARSRFLSSTYFNNFPFSISEVTWIAFIVRLFAVCDICSCCHGELFRDGNRVVSDAARVMPQNLLVLV